jgi:two-component system sensor histidine kinase PilS (NtrC family)
MSGSIQMLRADLDLDDEQRTLMEIVLKESTRLNRIIEEFLFYAKPAPPLPQPVDLRALVTDVVRIFRNSRELGPLHRIETEFVGDDLTLTADAGQLRQVVWNLLRNSVQAMPTGGRLVVRVGPGEPELVPLFVEDEGPGFDEEESDALWQPFHASSTEGSGLGLAIVYRIVRDHGGRVALGNRPTGGARVSVWLRRSGPEQPVAVPGSLGAGVARS